MARTKKQTTSKDKPRHINRNVQGILREHITKLEQLPAVKYIKNLTPDGKKKGINEIPYYTLPCFTIEGLVGSGSFGYVQKGYDKFKQCVAIKMFFNKLDKYAKREIEFLTTHTTHRHIVKFMGVIWDGSVEKTKEDPNPQLVYSGYVMEFMELGSLHEEIHNITRQYNMKLVWTWIKQISSALEYLHENDIIHRDVKPHNILLAQREHVQLADFGTARVIATKITAGCGTEFYMAPEAKTEQYGTASDVYSLGVVIWEILHRKHPSKHCHIVEKEAVTIAVPIIDIRLDKETSTLIKRCWEITHTERPSIQDIINFFETRMSKSSASALEMQVVPGWNDGVNQVNSMEQHVAPQAGYVIYDTNIPMEIATLPGENNVNMEENRYVNAALGEIRPLQGVNNGEPNFFGTGGLLGSVVIKQLDTGFLARQKEIYKSVDMLSNVLENLAWAEQQRNRPREILLSSELVHPNIAKVLSFISTSERREDINALVMEGKADGILETYAQRYPFSDEKVRILGLQLASALQYCHNLGVMHRDVRPKNIYVHHGGNTLKLANFGYAKKGGDLFNTANRAEEVYYKAPEVITAAPMAIYSYPVDVYSFGLVLWSMAHDGRRPFINRAINPFAFGEYLQGGDDNRPKIRENLDEMLTSLIRWCWKTDFNQRPTMTDVMNLLQKTAG